jgi:phosphatidate cytidylyltransferase
MATEGFPFPGARREAAAPLMRTMPMSPHVKRWITGVIAVPLLFWIIAYGTQWLFAALIVAATLIGVAEYNRMAFGEGLRREKIETMAAAVAILLAAAAGQTTLMLAIISVAVMAVLILNLLGGGEQGPDMVPASRAILGILYIPLLMAHFILLRSVPQGVLWIFLLLVVAFSGDTAAYYVGRSLGKAKLLPKVSPGKTVEGTIGLVVGSTAGALVFRQLFFPGLPVAHFAVLGVVGSIVGQLGDLCESALKRAAGVKDSGKLLPGHGGILDRLDCLMFMAPFVYYYQALIVR